MNRPAHIPDRDDLVAELKRLISRRATREDVSVWARSWASADDSSLHGLFEDEAVWDALETLGLADLPGDGEEHYLYSPADFENWLDELLRALPNTSKPNAVDSTAGTDESP